MVIFLLHQVVARVKRPKAQSVQPPGTQNLVIVIIHHHHKVLAPQSCAPSRLAFRDFLRNTNPTYTRCECSNPLYCYYLKQTMVHPLNESG